ncbi:Putative hemolysin [Labilithrix luteola]|uniref:Putative hemolysin n=1 Tax=Labilithrix luteola TaxID=1391654 RepID=A0A0K1PRD8_9BACT|nr:hypothetical protein [Labilithrix luteola]AKU96098.1 Putative hemolysin [Labilithrix luteola]
MSLRPSRPTTSGPLETPHHRGDRGGAHEAEIAAVLAVLSTREIEDAVGAHRAPPLLRALVGLASRLPSQRLGKLLARFDARIAEAGIAKASREVLTAFGATFDVSGEAPRKGGLLVVTNHPGAYDALATVAALGRDDVALVAADRDFLRAMPKLREHLVFVADEGASERAFGVRRALAWLASGRALVQFGAGAIEPDTRFLRPRDFPLGAWREGTGLFADRASRCGIAVVPAFVSGVHSARAKDLLVVQIAERFGISTVAPLIQATTPGFRDVVISVRFGLPIDRHVLIGARDNGARTGLVRKAVLALSEDEARERRRARLR